MKITIEDIMLLPGQDESLLPGIVQRTYGLPGEPPVIIARKSLDARKKNNICYRYRLIAEVDDSIGQVLCGRTEIFPFKEDEPSAVPVISGERHVIMVGAGPAGVFSALRLARAGVRVSVLERGKSVEERMRDIALLEEQGILDPESNVLFGEGGAGTYSDGKLTARSRRPESAWFLREMINHGAQADISCNAKPHVGTDRLRSVVKNIRDTLTGLGSQVKFSCRVADILIEKGRCAGVLTSDGEEIRGDAVILASGHSARDVYFMLEGCGVVMERKGSAVGLRVEHPAELIREIQYGNSKYKRILPAAEYMVTHNNKESGRGAYSFCMCPGGAVINSSSEDGMLCVNGMSNSGRDSAWSNAALVVTVRPGDYGEEILDGIGFQRRIEGAAFAVGGGGFAAPAQRLTSFLKNRPDSSLPACTFRPGVKAADISQYLPEFIIGELKRAIPAFDRKMKGFLTEEALLIGAETRTSSTVRILRDKTYQSLSLKGLFPAGEGAGYAGGIVSSAVDGICAADSLISMLENGDL